MSDNTKIEWTRGDDGSAGASWNPVTGCTKVSPGCDHCYAERVTERFHGKGSFAKVVLHEDRLDQPLRWRRPRKVFVNSMSDLFHDDIPDDFIAEVFATMALAERHTFQVLTKRHGRMRSLLNSAQFKVEVQRRAILIADRRNLNTIWAARATDPAEGPLRNVWLGVSVENQQWADIRIPALLETPAAVRWLSCEPLLGPMNLDRYLWLTGASTAGPFRDRTGRVRVRGGGAGGQAITNIPAGDLSWVVVGGESGPGARPMHPDWARSLRDQCVAASVPFFFKQWGEWAPIGPLYEQHDGDDTADEARMDAVGWEVEERKCVVQIESTGLIADGYQPTDPRAWLMVRRGKKSAGRELDGRTWDEYPTAQTLAVSS